MNNILFEFKKELELIESLLLEWNVQDTENYQEWYEWFAKIYGERNTNLQLYSVYSLICLIANVFIAKFVFKLDLNKIQSSPKFFTNLNSRVKENYDLDITNELHYFIPVFNSLEEYELNKRKDLLKIVIKSVNSVASAPEYFFDTIVQKLLSTYIRHKSGEFYTPPFIVKKMVEEVYNFGDKVLDPCCGSGNFLIDIIKTILNSNKSHNDKLGAIKNIHGYDINPISVYLTKINLLYLLKENFGKIRQNLRVIDFLFEQEVNSWHEFDLLIGNPPWFTLRDVDSSDYQNKIKNLSDILEIKPLPKNVLNIEIASLFFYKAKTTYMKNSGKIFYVITRGVINGSHAARFRNFKGFQNIKVWMFTREITELFNIDFICIFAQKTDAKNQNSNLEIPFFLFSIDYNGKKLNYFDSATLKLEKTGVMRPYIIETKAGKTYSHKLVSSEEYKTLIPVETSEYKKLFHKGADLNPRNLIFVKYKEDINSLVEITPDTRIFKRAKEPWNQKAFTNEILEEEYLFKVIKSTELVKFYVYDHYYVFLPLNKKDLAFNYDNLKKNAKNFYDKINQFYLDNKKESTKNNSLMDNLNRWSKLINSRQISKIKVVYNNSGSNVNSAVVQGNFLVTGDLSFFATDNLNEAYYLSAILNSPLLTKQVQIKKSSRHIFKLPFELPIKLFDETNKNHLRLANLAKKAHQNSKALTAKEFKQNGGEISKVKIQALINENIAHILNQIDEIVNNELNTQ